MNFLSLSKLNKERSNWAVLALAFCFSLIVLFGSPLHDHDLDPSHLDLDCVSCHLVHSNIGLESDSPGISISTQATYWFAPIATDSFASAPLTSSSRAPPTFC